MAPARISLLVETNSLFLITGNLALWRRERSEILDQIAPRESDIGEIPCIFPVDQGYGLRDEFATDWFLRHSVCGVGDSATKALGGSGSSREFAGFWARALANPNRRPRVLGLEDGAARVCLCCQVRRFGFARDSPPLPHPWEIS